MVVMGVRHLFCVHGWRKTKEQQPWNNTKQIFPEQKTKRSFVWCDLCLVREVLAGIWNPLISGQIVNSFGQEKCTFDCQSGNFKNYASGNHLSTSSWQTDHLQHDLYADISYKFTLVCVFVYHACTQLTLSTLINDLVLFTFIIQC